MKIYNLPTFNTTLEFLTMLALSTGRLLKARLPFLTLPITTNTKKNFIQTGRDTRHTRCCAPSPRRLEQPQNTIPLRAARATRRTRAVYSPRKRPLSDRRRSGRGDHR